MRNFLRPLVLAVPLLLAGCDSLHARMLAQDGVNLYHRGQIAEAAAKFEAAEKLDPYIPAIQLDLGFATLSLYQAAPKSTEGTASATKAITAFEKFLQLRPQEERARVYLLQTFIDTGRYEDAVVFFRPATEKQPPDAEALRTLGIIASKTGRYDDAKSWYEKRIAVEPANADARLDLGVLIWNRLHEHVEILGGDRLALADTALGHLNESIKLKPKAPAAYTYANLVYRERATGEPDEATRTKDFDQARTLFQKAVELQKGTK